MNYLNKITADPNQTFFLTGINGQRITLNLYFRPTQQMWFMDVQTQNHEFNGLAIVSSPNCLRCFRHLIPFGIACTTSNGLDPHYVDDFSTQRANLYLLNADDVAEVEAGLFT